MLGVYYSKEIGRGLTLKLKAKDITHRKGAKSAEKN